MQSKLKIQNNVDYNTDCLFSGGVYEGERPEQLRMPKYFKNLTDSNGDRVILHCDINNFYASVACLDNPTVKGMPVAVAGSVKERHGIILAKNYEAKQFGIKTGETIWEAELKCPSIIIVPPNYKRQAELSNKVRHIYERYTDIVEPFGMDECWLDVTGSVGAFGSGYDIADSIRRAVRRETGLTISVGISYNKVFAKLGSDMKKPFGITEITRENFKEKVWGLEAGALLGVGRKTSVKLKSFGIFTIGDLAKSDISVLRKAFGKNGEEICAFANGLDDARVLSSYCYPKPKSISRSTTTPIDLTNALQVWKIYLAMSEEIALQLRENCLAAKGVRIHIKTNDLNVRDFDRSFDRPTDISAEIAERGMRLFLENCDFSVPLRSIGIGVMSLQSGDVFQQSIFDDNKKLSRLENQDSKLFYIRSRFGENAIFRGRLA